jgi:hypothetical protein
MTRRGRTLPIILKVSSKTARQRRSEGTTVLIVVCEDSEGGDHAAGVSGSESLIDELVREGARRMLATALHAEGDAYIAQFGEKRDENGRRLVVRNGHHRPREVLTAAGVVAVTAPRVNDRRTDPETGVRRRFASTILPAWCRRTLKITEVLPLFTCADCRVATLCRAGPVPGLFSWLSYSVITRLIESWKAEQRAFAPARFLGRGLCVSVG